MSCTDFYGKIFSPIGNSLFKIDIFCSQILTLCGFFLVWRSMFVHLEGRTREEAFKIGQEIAASVTAMNPNPVTLKMEKVYHPCVLLTKKRYVGYSYESPGQLHPTFDAKGIETIRRDSCAAVAKTLERSLRTLFETQDLSQVRFLSLAVLLE